MTTCEAVFIQYRNITDGWTERRTDRFAISISRVSMMTRDNNCSRTSANSFMNVINMIVCCWQFCVRDSRPDRLTDRWTDGRRKVMCIAPLVCCSYYVTELIFCNFLFIRKVLRNNIQYALKMCITFVHNDIGLNSFD